MQTYRLLTPFGGLKAGQVVELCDEGQIADYSERGWIEPADVVTPPPTSGSADTAQASRTMKGKRR